MENLTRENFCEYLATWMAENKITISKVAKAMNCSIPSLNRLLKKNSYPTDETLRQTGIMIAVGFIKYSKMSNAEKETISEKIGSLSGAGLGFASVTAVVGTLGTAGLSAAGIMSGLATAGSLIGGGAVAGVAVVAIVPFVAAGLGYGLVKGIKWVVYNYNSKIEKIDSRWESNSQMKPENN